MASTPEGRVKAKISKLLKQADNCYYFMPVQTGYGGVTLDYLGWSKGRPFGIEAKAPGKEPTMRQKITMRNMEEAGGKTFVIDGNPADYDALRLWLWSR